MLHIKRCVLEETENFLDPYQLFQMKFSLFFDRLLKFLGSIWRAMIQIKLISLQFEIIESLNKDGNCPPFVKNQNSERVNQMKSFSYLWVIMKRKETISWLITNSFNFSEDETITISLSSYFTFYCLFFFVSKIPSLRIHIYDSFTISKQQSLKFIFYEIVQLFLDESTELSFVVFVLVLLLFVRFSDARCWWMSGGWMGKWSISRYNSSKALDRSSCAKASSLL